MSCQWRLWCCGAPLCEVSSETHPGWKQKKKRGEGVRREWVNRRRRGCRKKGKETGARRCGGENKSRGAFDISSNEEHGGRCRGGHHDITDCRSAFYCHCVTLRGVQGGTVKSQGQSPSLLKRFQLESPAELQQLPVHPNLPASHHAPLPAATPGTHKSQIRVFYFRNLLSWFVWNVFARVWGNIFNHYRIKSLKFGVTASF